MIACPARSHMESNPSNMDIVINESQSQSSEDLFLFGKIISHTSR
jgi:hypothetical protein